jgi:hypothetical protein
LLKPLPKRLYDSEPQPTGNSRENCHQLLNDSLA